MEEARHERRITRVLLGIAAALFVMNFFMFVASRFSTPVFAQSQAPLAPLYEPVGCVEMTGVIAPEVSVDRLTSESRSIRNQVHDMEVSLQRHRTDIHLVVREAQGAAIASVRSF